HYTTQLRLEKQLYESEPWLTRQEQTELSPHLCKDMRDICEQLVDAESAWKEYAFMVFGNVSAANESESGRSIIERWNNLLKETRGVAARDFVAPNREKLQRVDKWFENWRARLSHQVCTIKPGEPPNIQPIDDDLFQDVWEEREEWRAPYRSTEALGRANKPMNPPPLRALSRPAAVPSLGKNARSARGIV